MKSSNDMHVFITDDDIEDREFLIRSMSKNGYSGHCSEFDNGVDLLTHLTENAEHLPELILLDLNMPGKNGFDTLEALKANPALHDIPVIILTASSRKEDRTKCHELGAGKFYSKPINAKGYTDLALSVIANTTEYSPEWIEN